MADSADLGGARADGADGGVADGALRARRHGHAGLLQRVEFAQQLDAVLAQDGLATAPQLNLSRHKRKKKEN